MSSSEAPTPHKSEEGDTIINWHLQYTAAVTLQGSTSLQQTSDLLKAELSKIKTDFDFIKKLSGSHENLLRLKATDRDIRNILDKLKEVNDLLRMVSSKAAKRIL